MMPSSADMAMMRAAVEQTMTLSGTITRVTKSTTTADDYGHPVTSGGGTVTSTTICALAKATDRTKIGAISSREAEMNYYYLTVPWNTDIQADDMIIVEGDSYAINMLHDDHILRVSKRATVSKVD
jgi:hypothetical protein